MQCLTTCLMPLLLLAIANSASGMDSKLKAVRLVPVGRVEEGLLGELAQSLKEKLGVTAEVAGEVELLKSTFDAGRRQYHSTSILQTLEKTHPYERGLRPLLLAVTEVDLFVPTLNFVFGEALPTKDMAIISLCRLRQEFYGRPTDPTLLRERMVKEAVHEIGHVWGIRHCSDPHCVMFFSNSLMDTDRKSDTFCKRCKSLLRENVQD